jgi:hypothetical protein
VPATSLTDLPSFKESLCEHLPNRNSSFWALRIEPQLLGIHATGAGAFADEITLELRELPPITGRGFRNRARKRTCL